MESSQRSTRQKSAFTLIELLLVIGIIAILSSIVIVAVNPQNQLEDAKNSQRQSDLNQLQKAVSQYLINGGELTFIDDGYAPMPENIYDALPICKELGGHSEEDCESDGGYPLNSLTGQYVVSLPVDPDFENDQYYTGYYIYQQGFEYQICNQALDCTCGGAC